MKAPRSCPNSSVSSRVSGIAAQATLMSGCVCLPLSWWMARATSSLPVPVSPWISTVASLGATVAMRSAMRAMLGLA